MSLHEIEPGTPVVVGDRAVPMPEIAPGDTVVAVQRTGDLLVVPAETGGIVDDAVARAERAFRELATAPDDAITSFFRGFADRLADDAVWGRIAEANAGDVESATERGRSTTRLAVSDKMRDGMIEGLLGWAKTPSRRGEVIERRDGEDWTVERRRAPLGVVAFVFEGRPNVFADGAGVVRGGNASVMRIGSDALGTAIAIADEAIRPALAEVGLPEGTISLVRSREHAAAWSLFTRPEVRLAVARGSGPAVELLGSIAIQHGIQASLHGTGGGWVWLADASEDVVRRAVVASLDRKVCNTMNVCVLPRDRARELAGAVLAAMDERDPSFRIHVTPDAMEFVPAERFEREVVVRRASGEVTEAQAEPIAHAELGTEWEWEGTPEFSVVTAADDDEAVELVNRHSPRFVASILTGDAERFERFYERVDTPYVGNGFTRWVDGQWAWDRPELGLTNWERGRLMGRSGILAGDDVYTVRDVFLDRTGEARQHR